MDEVLGENVEGLLFAGLSQVSAKNASTTSWFRSS